MNKDKAATKWRSKPDFWLVARR